MSGMRWWLGGALALALLGGCGGGGGSSSSPAGGEVAFGDFVGRAASTNPPITTFGSGTTVTGITGAFTSLRLRDQFQSIAESQIVFATNGQNGNNDIFMCNGDGTNVRQVTKTPENEFNPELSPDGTKIAFARAMPSGFHNIFTIKTDGTGLTQITTTSGFDSSPTWSPDGSELAFESARNQNSGDLYRINVTTKTENPIFPFLVGGVAQGQPSWSPDGQWIAYIDYGGDGSGEVRIGALTDSGGGGPNSAGVQANPSWSPDSRNIAYVNDGRISFMTPRVVSGEILPGVTDASFAVAYSPDGSQLAYTYGNPLRLKVVTTSGAPVWSAPPGQYWYQPHWGNAPKDRTLVGSGSIFGSAAAGFIYSTKGGDTQSMLAFGATTQSTVVMKGDAGNVDSPTNLIYSIDADTITYISHTSSPTYKAVKVVGAGLGVPQCDGALISIDAANGKIVAILPFNGTRAEGRPRVSHKGGQTTLTGAFLGVFDAEGKNRAPSGATSVRIEGETLSMDR